MSSLRSTSAISSESSEASDDDEVANDGASPLGTELDELEENSDWGKSLLAKPMRARFFNNSHPIAPQPTYRKVEKKLSQVFIYYRL